MLVCSYCTTAIVVLQEEDEMALQEELKKRQVHICYHIIISPDRLFVRMSSPGADSLTDWLTDCWMLTLQWAALIEERRAKQQADKKQEIEAQQQNFLADTLAEKKLVRSVQYHHHKVITSNQ